VAKSRADGRHSPNGGHAPPLFLLVPSRNANGASSIPTPHAQQLQMKRC
jgi:hypothetical protein